MTGILKRVTIFVAVALVIFLTWQAVPAQGKPNKPKPQPTSQPKGDLDRDRDRDRDKDGDRDMDRDRDRDRDRVSVPLSAQEKAVMMQKMQKDRNHLMAVGYRQNMLNFAMNLRLQLERGQVDRDYAKGAVKEIKRNFKEMERRHNAHKKEMSAQMREQASEMIRAAEEHHERIRTTIRNLENAANSSSDNSRQMLMHVRELEEQLRMMEQERERNYTGATAPAAGIGAIVDIAPIESP